MNSRLIFVCLISIVLLASGCDKSPTLVAVQKSSEAKGHQSKLMALAEKGDVQAQVDLGDLFRKGQEVAKDLRKAMEWYQKAAALGNAQAQANLGEIYEEGEGVAKDVATAIEWYQKAAAQGNAFGLLKLGECYRYGSGVKEDTAKAFEL